MNKVLIIGNWKMNPRTHKQAEQLLKMINKNLNKSMDTSEIVVCPPFIYLKPAIKILKTKVKFGVQNCHWKQAGAYTGEISPAMIKDSGCKYVIIGHSERRKYFKETDSAINKKVLAAINEGLKVILCVGEKENQNMASVVKKQLQQGLAGVSRIQAEKLIVAYEPVWAIGSGNPCSADKALEAKLFIKKTISNIYGRNLGDKLPIIYGGSVNSKIVKKYIKQARMNGLLIGGASLDAREFVNIIEEVND